MRQRGRADPSPHRVIGRGDRERGQDPQQSPCCAVFSAWRHLFIVSSCCSRNRENPLVIVTPQLTARSNALEALTNKEAQLSTARFARRKWLFESAPARSIAVLVI
jgi:hypothetical protein